MGYLLFSLSISVFILGVHFVIESLLLNLFNYNINDLERSIGKLSYPLIVCPTCMTSFWGITAICIFSEFSLIENILILFQIGFFNYVFSKIIP